MCNKFRQDENSIKIPKILNSSISLFIDHSFEFLHIYLFLSSIITKEIAKGKITECARLHGKQDVQFIHKLSRIFVDL